MSEIEDLDRLREHFDLARRHFRVARLFAARGDLAFDAITNSDRDSFAASQRRLARAAGAVDDDLTDSRTVAEIEEDEITEVALLVNPSGKRDVFSGVLAA